MDMQTLAGRYLHLDYTLSQCRVTPEMTHLACRRCAWRRCKTCACPSMGCVLRLALPTDGGAIYRHFKRDTTLGG